MSNAELFHTLLEDYFIKAKQWGILPEIALDAIVSSLKSKDVKMGKWMIQNAKLYERCLAKQRGKGEERPLSEYLYIASLLEAMIVSTDASMARIGRCLDCGYIFSRYQYFHSLPARRVIMHLLLRHESLCHRRIEKQMPRIDEDEDKLRFGTRMLRKALPLEELADLHPFFVDGANEMVLRSIEPSAIVYLSKGKGEAEQTRRFIEFARKEGNHVYAVSENGEDRFAEVTIVLESKRIVVYAYSQRYSIIPSR